MPYYFGKWIWDSQELLWKAPGSPIGQIDFRSDFQASQKGIAEGFGLFVYDNPQVGLDLFIGNSLADNVQATIPSIEALLGITAYSIQSTVLSDIIFELLTEHCDPLGASRWRPVIPEGDSLVVHQGKGVVIRSDIFKLGVHSASNKILEAIQEDYRKIRLQVLDGKAPAGQHRKYLRGLMDKYNTHNYMQFIPNDLPKEFPLTRATTVTDDFNRTNEAIEVSSDWTLLNIDSVPNYGSMDIFSNRVRPDLVASVNTVQNQNPLSSTDMDVSITVITLNTPASSRCSSIAGARVAANTSGPDGYFADLSVSSAATQYCRLVKKVNGTPTILNDTIQAHSLPDIVTVKTSGSSISSLFNGTTIGSVTDTSISSGLYHGIDGYLPSGSTVGDSVSDNYIATDDHIIARSMLSSTNIDNDQILESLILARGLASALSVNDIALRYALLERLLQDSAGINDYILASIIAYTIYVRNLTDAIDIVDAYSRFLDMYRTLTSSLSAEDVVLRYIEALRILSSTATIDDVIVSDVISFLVTRVLSDGITMSDEALLSLLRSERISLIVMELLSRNIRSSIEIKNIIMKIS